VLSKSTIGIMPNLIENQQLMLIPTKLAEYMASALPIICSNLPYQSKIIMESNCGFVADPAKVDSFIDHILELYYNKELAKKLGENGRKSFINKYTWELELEKLKIFYNKILCSNNV